MSSTRNVKDLIWEWDPIGLSAVRDEVPDEYDELARIVASMLDAGSHPSAIVERLAKELSTNWGIGIIPTDLESRIARLYR